MTSWPWPWSLTYFWKTSSMASISWWLPPVERRCLLTTLIKCRDSPTQALWPPRETFISLPSDGPHAVWVCWDLYQDFRSTVKSTTSSQLKRTTTIKNNGKVRFCDIPYLGIVVTIHNNNAEMEMTKRRKLSSHWRRPIIFANKCK